MQLFYSQTSPFARKVNLLLHYTSLINECELVMTTFESDDLRAKNPLGKIPALVDGPFSLFESSLICEYLDDKHALSGAPSLYNRGIGAYYEQQKVNAYANGILDAAVATIMEIRRATEHSTYWLERWDTAIENALSAIDIKHAGTAEKPNIATFSLAAALGYLDFRLANLAWRAGHPELAAWFEKIEETEWFAKTAPPAAA